MGTILGEPHPKEGGAIGPVSNECISLDLSLREAAYLSSFKRSLSEVTFKIKYFSISKHYLPACVLLNVCF